MGYAWVFKDAKLDPQWESIDDLQQRCRPAAETWHVLKSFGAGLQAYSAIMANATYGVSEGGQMGALKCSSAVSALGGVMPRRIAMRSLTPRSSAVLEVWPVVTPRPSYALPMVCPSAMCAPTSTSSSTRTHSSTERALPMSTGRLQNTSFRTCWSKRGCLRPQMKNS